MLTSLAGTWQANVHELDQAVATATVTVSGNNVDIMLDVAGRSAKFSGIYASGSGVLEANGVKLSKTDAQMNVILLSCRNAALCRKPFREGFIRIR